MTQSDIDYLKSKKISVAELRMALAEFSKDGITEINLYDFLSYLSGLLHEAEENSPV